MKQENFEKVKYLKELFEQYECFYVVDVTGMSANDSTFLRNECFGNGVVFKIMKNSLIKKALENVKIVNETAEKIKTCLTFISGLMFVKDNCKFPAKIISTLKNKVGKGAIKLKCAYINGDLFFGDEKLNELSKLKTKDEIIGDVVASLSDGLNNVVNSLASCENKICYIIEKLVERG